MIMKEAAHMDWGGDQVICYHGQSKGQKELCENVFKQLSGPKTGAGSVVLISILVYLGVNE